MVNLWTGSCLTVLLGVAITLSSLSERPVDAKQSNGHQSSGYLSNYGFYHQKCPNVEYIIYSSMRESFRKDSTVAPGILRIAFHDCFVRGCDASVLLDGPDTEKKSPLNPDLHGWEAIDAAKEAVEKACSGVVSCADIVQFAARDSVVLTGGQGWPVPAGRRDGTVSKASEPIKFLPAPQFDVPSLLPLFKNKGLNAAQMVTLSGAHTIGIAHCDATNNRLYTFNSSSTGTDPSLPADFAASLKKQCPKNSPHTVNLDLVTPHSFDYQYFENIINDRGLLTSDQSLLNDLETKGAVHSNNGEAFSSNFGQAMIAMSKIDVLTGSSGQIRRHCRSVN